MFVKKKLQNNNKKNLYPKTNLGLLRKDLIFWLGMHRKKKKNNQTILSFWVSSWNIMDFTVTN